MARKTTSPAQHLDPALTPDARHTFSAPFPRRESSEWERGNAAPGWHVRVAIDGGEHNAALVSVAQDNVTCTFTAEDGSTFTAPRHAISQVNLRPLTDWELGVVKLVVEDAELRGSKLVTTGDTLTIAHAFGRKWLAMAGGAKTKRILAALRAEHKAQTTTAAPAPTVAADAS